MNRLYGLVGFAFIHLSCATPAWEPAIEVVEQSSQIDGFKLGEYGQSLIAQSSRNLQDQKRILEKNLATKLNWEDQLKLALVIMSESVGVRDFNRIRELLLAVSRNKKADDELRASAKWLLAINQQTQMTVERLHSETAKNIDLEQKIQDLSSIEKKLEKRTRQELR